MIYNSTLTCPMSQIKGRRGKDREGEEEDDMEEKKGEEEV